MTFTESNTVEQMMLDAATNLGGKQASVRHWNTSLSELTAQVALGEDSRCRFKQDMQSLDALAAEMTAFTNSDGGVISLGVTADSSLPGLSPTNVLRPSQMISNVAAQHVRPDAGALISLFYPHQERGDAHFALCETLIVRQMSRSEYT